MKDTPFSGSYRPEDCIFLLKPISMAAAKPQESGPREVLIQSGKRHYSETIPMEHPPRADYLRLFELMLATHKRRLAAEIRFLAHEADRRRRGPITLLSLARAGTPVGVLIQRALRRFFNRDVVHYSISIIRDRGLDTNALRYVLEGRPAEGIIFVDGWTAKGTITQELKIAVARWNQSHPQNQVPAELFVVSDVGGQADVAATDDDYVIPSGILNSVISGLVSRSAMVDVGPDDFHSCVHYRHLQGHDKSREFIEEIEREMVNVVPAKNLMSKQERRAKVAAFLDQTQQRYTVPDINRIKPGIAEATRALLRRTPSLLLVRNPQSPDVQHILLLARLAAVPYLEEPDMPFNAATLIGSRSSAQSGDKK